MLKDKSQYLYQPFFCEENIWHLTKRLITDRELTVQVLYFINEQQAVLMTQQIAFGPKRLGCWDYHVVLSLPQEKIIVDFDSLLGFQSELRQYFSDSFPDQELIDNNFRLTVRIVDGRDYLEFFSSDRSHMIDANGRLLAPFPEWPKIQSESNPLHLVDLRDPGFQDERLRDQSIADYLKDVGE